MTIKDEKNDCIKKYDKVHDFHHVNLEKIGLCFVCLYCGQVRQIVNEGIKIFEKTIKLLNENAN